MAGGPFTILDVAKKKFFDGTFDLDSHAFKAVLTTDAQGLTAAFVGASGNGLYADLTAQAPNGGGYTTGGQALAGVTLGFAAGVVKWDANDLLWAALTASNLAYVVVYDDSVSGDPIVGFAALNVGGTISPAAADLTVRWNASGILTATG